MFWVFVFFFGGGGDIIQRATGTKGTPYTKQDPRRTQTDLVMSLAQESVQLVMFLTDYEELEFKFEALVTSHT